MLPQIAMQQHLQGSHERHEQSGAFLMAQTSGSLDEARRQSPPSTRCMQIVQGGSIAAIRKLDGGQGLAKLLSPVYELLNDLGV